MKQLVWLESFRNDIFGFSMGFLLPDRRGFLLINCSNRNRFDLSKESIALPRGR